MGPMLADGHLSCKAYGCVCYAMGRCVAFRISQDCFLAVKMSINQFCQIKDFAYLSFFTVDACALLFYFQLQIF